MSLTDWLLQGNQAFTNPANVVGDVVRLFDIVVGVVALGLCLRLARAVRNTRQYGIIACVCYGVSAIGTEIQQLGNIVTYRLLFNTAGVVLTVMFLWKTTHPVDHHE
jgi:hypothetical protein